MQTNEDVRPGKPLPAGPDGEGATENAAEALEVVVCWGESILHVAHISPPRPFAVGERFGVDESEEGREAGFLMGREVLGRDHLSIVVETREGMALSIPRGAKLSILPIDAVGRAAAQEANDVFVADNRGDEPKLFLLPGEGTVGMELAGFTFLVRMVPVGHRFAGHGSLDRRPLAHFGGSLLLFGSVLSAFHFVPRTSASLSLERLDDVGRFVPYRFAADSVTPPSRETGNDPSSGEDAPGKAHTLDEGAMGRDTAKTKARAAILEPVHDPSMARDVARSDAAYAGVLGTLRAMQGAWDSSTSPYDRDRALGSEAENALGALFGETIGENFGFGGLGMRGTGKGAGGEGEGTLGVGDLATIGRSDGKDTGRFGYGVEHERRKPRHAVPPRISADHAEIRGSLPKEVVRRVVHRHLSEVRFCYERELAGRPDLAGRVAVRFVIQPDGAVGSVFPAESTVPSPRVASCIVEAVRRWSFPAPDGGGVVVVTYPFVMTPSN